MATFTTNKGYYLPTVGGDRNQWGTFNNASFGILDKNMGGTYAANVAGSADFTVTDTNAQNIFHQLTGVPTADIDYLLPARAGFYDIVNGSTGAFTVTAKTVTGGSVGVIVPQGSAMLVRTDGTNVRPCVGMLDGKLVSPDGVAGDQVVNFSQFAPTTGANGQTLLPGGLRMQWGRATTDVSGVAAIIFPVPFGSANYSIVDMYVVGLGSGGAITSSIVDGTETASGVTLQAQIATGGMSANRPLRWIAIGDA